MAIMPPGPPTASARPVPDQYFPSCDPVHSRPLNRLIVSFEHRPETKAIELGHVIRVSRWCLRQAGKEREKPVANVKLTTGFCARQMGNLTEFRWSG